jgi:hypothetical protein
LNILPASGCVNSEGLCGVSIRNITQRAIGGDSHVGNTDERLDIFNELAVVKENIGPGQNHGRIRYLESDWSALGDGSVIRKGVSVRIVCLENIGFIVEPIAEEMTNSIVEKKPTCICVGFFVPMVNQV